MSSSTTHPYLPMPGADQVPNHHHHHHQNHHHHQQMLFHQQQTQFYHVPQHSRREKLRYGQNDDPNSSLPVASLYSPPFLTQPPPGVLPAEPLPIPYPAGMLSLSSSTKRQQIGSSGGFPGPYGPFTGYAAVLGRSRFLGPARMLLDEICDVNRREIAQDMVMGGGSEDGGMEMDVPGEVGDRGMEGGSGGEVHWKKTRLLSLMEEVCKRYKQYYQQVQSVITSFESVAGLSSTSPFASVALKSMSKHFKCLKGMILNQLKNANKMNGKEAVNNREEIPNFGLLSGGNQRGNNSIGTSSLGQQHNQPQHIWRPQRGLPERAVSVLRAWLFEHFLHPYPTDTDKQMLAKQTGLTRNQVSNWFINARVRLWKPMVEEIHNLEMCQMRRHSGNDNNNKIPNQNPGIMPSTQQQQISECSGSNPSDLVQGQSSHTNPNNKSMQHSDQLAQIPNSIPEQINFGYGSLGTVGFNAGSSTSNPSGVSLTLGLQQNNNRVCLAETIPVNLVHRFGLEDCNDPYVMGSFDATAPGRHLLHDFVG